METWSAELEKFRVNFFLDTNILCYLVDDTYPTLTAFIKALGQMPVVKLYSSEYVLAEFIGVRKQEGYFQETLDRAGRDGRKVNVSSFLKDNKKYEIPNYPYNDLAEAIKNHVGDEVDQITGDFNIQFSCNFNENLLVPMMKVCLSTKVSREDSLVLVSSIYKNSTEKISEDVIILTNDGDFERWTQESKEIITSVLQDFEVNLPYVEHVSKIGTIIPTGGQKNLYNENVENAEELAIDYITRILLWKYKDHYIGNTIVRICPNPPAGLIAFMPKRALTEANQYLIILDKKLRFVYCPQPKSVFYHRGSPISSPYNPEGGNSIVTFVCNETNEEVYNAVKAEGNLIFVHPDAI